MSELESAARGLLELDEDQLTAKLGLLEQSGAGAKGARGADGLEDLYNLPEPKGGLDDLLKIGKNVFGPASEGAYKALCSDIGGDSDIAKELTNLMGQKTADASAKATALLTPILASAGLPQSLAVVVGALLVKKLAKGIAGSICTTWKANIDGTST
jgi:hypothetical protein